ncbi:MAG: ImmA/IrrE family metallo-endopeptidase [Gordonia sp. (in: high G+C Gram-positive bacteria)]|uniref:ImmA/IrrE family metallo-endopeptidase n=1 Tax=Gordonia sp. (in: high G+C Gram-positive bacteria) TaxID=84139 RepID=UPI003C77C832
MYDPWRHADTELPHVTIHERADLPPGLLGLTDGASIWLSRRLTAAARTCTLAHEIMHIERGPTPDIVWLADREHRIIDRAVARRLIDLDTFVDVLAERDGMIDRGVADTLHVDWPTLLHFVDALTPGERAMIDAELARRAA